ncbi:biotin--acetyl-CoA-carboxylase ligase [Sulfurifustis variabilis]|uniref:Bifunctional ligase/repressor BirA n=1 Tax=Sulfurifustis variabilis TaxID=1675686 RepID=A0A1B4VBQ2_9GAMM|nr:bifunctional biotin--[acetyl-CoA-carboxylase] ligase/biotin operon repressor BirA [Sulfurifustis variabilis]BAU49924.1 biotin--acetyl-CoA-carboxylase ligase [Sulfurifustis variabilis]
MTTRAEILKLLADGQFHSGTDLGRRLGVSRAAVNKGVRALASFGLEIHSVPGRGYKLPEPVDPLDRDAILAELGRRGDLPHSLEVLETVDSTNRYLIQRASALVSGSVCLSETQTQGRGRRGRGWLATPYRNLLLSMAWRFDAGPATVAAFGLAAGLALLEALEEYGARGIGLKWPNDVVWRGRKLAGLLADVQGEAAGPALVVLGAGINCRLGAREAEGIDQPWVDLEEVLGSTIDRNRLAALVIGRLHDACRTFGARGFGPFRQNWERRHVYHGQSVRLMTASATIAGTVAGVDSGGALRLIDARGDERVYHAGEISLRGA